MLLVVLDVVEVYSLHSVAEVVFVYLCISCKTERNSNGLCFLKAKGLEMLLVVEFIINFVQDHSESSFDPKHHIVAFPEDLRPFDIDFQHFIKSLGIFDRF